MIRNDVELMKILLKAGANCERRDANGKTALLLAIELGDSSVALTLLSAGCNLPAADSSGTSAVDLAIRGTLELRGL